ncbi:hypothetical protein INR49_008711 [Caranx melampygus]|nr:hypothetical protein INR49_008711 [Caranx melampygus]
MDQKVHPWPLSGHHLHRPKDRGDYYRYSQQNRDQSFPPLVPKERDKHRAHPDPRYTADFIDLPARLEQFPYNSHLFPCDHGPSDYQRPQSRHGYNYPPHSHWNYRENYGMTKGETTPSITSVTMRKILLERM